MGALAWYNASSLYEERESMHPNHHEAADGQPHSNYNPHSGDPAAPTNPALLDAMRAVALNDGPETRAALYRELKTATFVVPLPETPPGHAPGFERPREGEPAVAVAMQDMHGRMVVPVFTDTTALFAWGAAEASYTAMAAATMFSLVLEVNADALVINIAGPSGGEVSQAEVHVLAQGGVPGSDATYTFPDGARAMLRLPNPAPAQDLVDALWRAAAAQSSVDSAYLVEIAVGQGPPHLLAGIEFAPLPGPEQVDTAMRTMVDAVNHAADPGRYVDFMVLVPGQQMADEVKEIGLPVYRRVFAPGSGN
jgi:hypothetical protein